MEVLYIFNTLSSKMPKNGICLSGNISVEVDHNEMVFNIRNAVSQNEKGFYGNQKIKSVSAYVGENGVGKTYHVCGAIHEFFALRHDYVGVCVFRDDSGELRIISSFHYSGYRYKLIDAESGAGVEIIQNEMFDELPKQLKSVHTIYFSNSVNGSLRINNSINDISTSGILREVTRKQRRNDPGEESQGDFEEFRKREMRKQIEFLDHLKKYDIKLDKFNNSSSIAFEISSGTFYPGFFNTEFVKGLNQFVSQRNNSLLGGLKVLDEVGRKELCNVLFYSLIRITKVKSLRNEAIDLISKASFGDNILTLLKEAKGELYYRFNKLLSFVFHQGLGDVQFPLIGESDGQKIYAVQFLLKRKFFGEFYKMLDSFLAHDFKDLDYDWPISSGENALLSLYSRLFKNTWHFGCKNVILLLDEADAFYHPDWSRHLVNDLINTIPKIIFKSTIQLIITAHSPFVLSDIPSQDVFRLEKKNDELIISQDLSNQTFAANIHSLLANSFFMKNGYIGEFAKSFIEKLIVRIDDLKKINEKQFDFKSEFGEIQRGIELVGDRVIKLRLEQKLSEAIRGLGAETKSKVRLLEEKNDLERRLKKINKDLKDD